MRVFCGPRWDTWAAVGAAPGYWLSDMNGRPTVLPGHFIQLPAPLPFIHSAASKTSKPPASRSDRSKKKKTGRKMGGGGGMDGIGSFCAQSGLSC